MLRSDAHDVMIQGRCTNTYCLKFVPRKDILQCGKYYDRGTRILEFPVYVCVLSKKFLTVPPCKMVVVAVITEDNGLSLSCGDFRFATYRHACCDEDVCNCESHAEYVVDLGDCTTAEAVYTDLIIANNSYVSQVFGFVNLPPCLQIMPNFGFGELMPLETKTLTLIYIPEVSDILNYDVECGDVNLRVEHRIKVETLKSLGGIDEDKPRLTVHVVRKLMDVIEREMNRIVPWALLEDFYQLVDLLRDFSLSTSSWPTLSGPCPSLNEIVDEKKEMEIKNNKISVKATIVDPLCDLSHQYVEFPDTPCGSYSIMRIDLRAHTCIANSKCLCYYKKKYGKCKDPLSYRARFEIGSNDAQFSVEPNGGTLHAGQIKKLHVIVRPELPDEKIKEAAQELALRKLEKKSIAKTASSTAAISTEATKMGGASKKVRRERSITKTSETTKATETKTKKKIESTKAKRNQIGFADSEVVVSPGDLYRTEKELLKHMEPYVAKARFCCTVSYASEDFERDREKLYFDARCFVIRPCFVHDLDSKHISFGKVSVTEPVRRIITLENISDSAIRPVVSALSPIGFFTIPRPRDLKLEPDHVLHLPLTCDPCAVENVKLKVVITGTGDVRSSDFRFKHPRCPRCFCVDVRIEVVTSDAGSDCPIGFWTSVFRRRPERIHRFFDLLSKTTITYNDGRKRSMLTRFLPTSYEAGPGVSEFSFVPNRDDLKNFPLFLFLGCRSKSSKSFGHRKK